MSRHPIVAIIGRPNVGKSTLVNRIIGARKAIVDDQPGVTRDRAYYLTQWQERAFMLMDTGGLDPTTDDHFGELVNQQVGIALEEADALIFVVDGTTGVTALDETVAQMIRQSRKTVYLAVNKIDTPEQRMNLAEFYSLGLGDPIAVSAMHGSLGVGDLLEQVVTKLPQTAGKSEEAKPIRIALVGKPNVGKSSILNKIFGKQRSIVSNEPGTTRDSVDIPVVHEGQAYTLVDTAGIRRKSKVHYGIELFSVDRSLQAIRQSDVTVLVIDAQDGITDQDKKIIETSNDAGRGLVLVVNKWDTVENKDTNSVSKYTKELYKEVNHASFAKILFTSASTGQRLFNIFTLAKEAYENNHRRVKTSLVNEVLMEAFSLMPPPVVKNKTLKLLYATQASEAPPTFILFVNNAKQLKDSYCRYLERKLRESFEFTGTPLALIARNRGESK